MTHPSDVEVRHFGKIFSPGMRLRWCGLCCFFSGGYVTVLTAAFVALFGMTFVQGVATTKLINIFSSGIATVVFLSRGVVDLKLSVILGVSMFVGGLLGRPHRVAAKHELAAEDIYCRCVWARGKIAVC